MCKCAFKIFFGFFSLPFLKQCALTHHSKIGWFLCLKKCIKSRLADNKSLKHLKTILNDLLDQNKTEIAKIQHEMNQNNHQLSEINQTITETMDQVFKQLNAEIKRTNQKLTLEVVEILEIIKVSKIA